MRSRHHHSITLIRVPPMIYKAKGRGILISGSLSFIAGKGGAQSEELRLRADSLWSILSTAGGCLFCGRNGKMSEGGFGSFGLVLCYKNDKNCCMHLISCNPHQRTLPRQALCTIRESRRMDESIPQSECKLASEASIRFNRRLDTTRLLTHLLGGALRACRAWLRPHLLVLLGHPSLLVVRDLVFGHGCSYDDG